MIKIFRKLEKILKFHRKITKTGVLKILFAIPITLESIHQPIINSWRKDQKKIQKHEKLQILCNS